MEKLFDYLDGELTAERMRVVREHIRSCSSCYPHYDFEKLVLDSLNTLREEKGAPEELRKKVLEALKAEGFSA
jgi:anti-sigma factor (TIGR02949 family)